MVIKKKSCHVSLYLALFIAFLEFCIVFLYGSSSHAMTSQEIDVVVDTFLNNVENPSTAVNLNTFLSQKSSWGDYIYGLSQSDVHSWSNVSVTDFLDYVENYDSLIIFNSAQSLSFQFFDSSYSRNFVNNTSININGNNNQYAAQINIYNTGDQPRLYYQNGLSGTGTLTNNIYAYISTVPVYRNNSVDTTFVYYVEDYTPVPPSSITLTATSHNKYEFTTYNQCHANIMGYAIYDFDFWLQRYDEINDVWGSIKTFIKDWRWAQSSEPGNVTDFYIYFPYMNTMPAGIYRYVADYKGENAFSVVSNNFNIYYANVIDSSSGTVDSSGNITINTNNGNTVDNIKDTLIGEADIDSINIDSDSIHNAINLPSTVNPYDNFLMVFLNGLTGALTNVTPFYLKFQVHDWRSYS